MFIGIVWNKKVSNENKPNICKNMTKIVLICGKNVQIKREGREKPDTYGVYFWQRNSQFLKNTVNKNRLWEIRVWPYNCGRY